MKTVEKNIPIYIRIFYFIGFFPSKKAGFYLQANLNLGNNLQRRSTFDIYKGTCLYGIKKGDLA